MANWCLPPQFTQALVKALSSGDVKVTEMATMESAERRALLAKYVGADNARELNASFEKKLLLKDWQRGMVSWLKSSVGMSDKAKNTLIDKVIGMKEILTPADRKTFLADYVSKRLGTEVTADEGDKIAQLAQTAMLERDKPKTNLDGTSVAEIKAQSDLKHYLASLTPTTAVIQVGKNVISTMRTFKIANPSVMIKSAISQTENHAMGVISRRLAGNAKMGDSNALASTAETEAWATFRATKVNTAAIENGVDGEKLGEPGGYALPEGMLSTNKFLSQAERTSRAIAKWTNAIVIDVGHNLTYVKFYQKAFFDSLNISTTNVAIGRGLTGADRVSYANRLFLDATKVVPTTLEGKAIRAASQYQAQKVTSSNPNFVSDFAVGARKLLNGVLSFKATKYSPQIGLGDVIVPMAKIPGAVIWNGIATSTPVGLGLAAHDIVVGGRLRTSADPMLRLQGDIQYARGWQHLILTTGVMAAGALFASMLDPKRDFKTDDLGHTTVRIGGVWIDTEYVAWMSPGIAAMMEVRKDVHNYMDVGKVVVSYGHGALQGIAHAPGVSNVQDLLTRVAGKGDPVAGLEKWAIASFVPSIAHNAMNTRPIDRILAGAHGVETEEDVREDENLKRQNAAKGRITKTWWNSL